MNGWRSDSLLVLGIIGVAVAGLLEGWGITAGLAGLGIILVVVLGKGD